MPINQPIVMTYSNKTNTKLSDTEYQEMVALKKAINEYPQAVVPEKLEEFSEYLVRSLKELGN
jgi:hypothetical protein